jgi:hypothetical protein
VSVSDLPDLSDAELEKLVPAIGPRRRLRARIAELPRHVPAPPHAHAHAHDAPVGGEDAGALRRELSGVAATVTAMRASLARVEERLAAGGGGGGGGGSGGGDEGRKRADALAKQLQASQAELLVRQSMGEMRAGAGHALTHARAHAHTQASQTRVRALEEQLAELHQKASAAVETLKAREQAALAKLQAAAAEVRCRASRARGAAGAETPRRCSGSVRRRASCSSDSTG